MSEPAGAPIRVRPASLAEGAAAADVAATATAAASALVAAPATPPRHASLLDGPNPFDATPVRDPWQPPVLGTAVSGPFDRAALALERAIAAIATDPSRRTRSLLILGEPGAGKTHGVQGLIAAGLAARAHVAWIDRFGDGSGRLTAIAARLVRDLGRQPPAEPGTQLEALLTAALAPEPLPWSDTYALAGATAVRAAAARLVERDPALDRRLVQVLLRAAGEGRGAAARRLFDELSDWLRGAQPTGDTAARLGLRGAFGGEDAAFELLATLARLAARGRPLLVILDHPEALGADAARADAEVRSLVAALCRLHDCVPNLALALVCRTTAWHRAFERRLNASERARLLGERIELDGLDASGAEALVAARIRAHLGEAPAPYPTWPFPTALLDAAVPLPPGELLELCRRELSAQRQQGALVEVARFGAQAAIGGGGGGGGGSGAGAGASGSAGPGAATAMSGTFARPGGGPEQSGGFAWPGGAPGRGAPPEDDEARAARAGLGRALFVDALSRVPAAPRLSEERLAHLLERAVRAVAGRRLLDDPALESSGRFAREGAAAAGGGGRGRSGDASGAPLRVLALADAAGGPEARLGFAIAGPREPRERSLKATLDALEGALPGLTRLVLLRHDPDAPAWKKGLAAYERLLAGGMRERALDPASCRALAALDKLLARADQREVRAGATVLDAAGVLRLLAREGVLEGAIPVIASLLAGT